MSVLLAVVAVNCLCLGLGEPIMETWCWFWVISTTVDLGELNKSKLVIIIYNLKSLCQSVILNKGKSEVDLSKIS